jgi:hypothetical protein
LDNLERGIDWTGAFWVTCERRAAAGAVFHRRRGRHRRQALLAGLDPVDRLGFIQSFTYAEIAGLFPNKSGGTSVYGAIAWVRYSKVIAPISVWCNWFAWSPVQATGSALAAGYILNACSRPDSAINTWQITLLDLGFVKTGLSLRINAVFLLGAVLMFAVKAIQDGGILRSANTTKILGISAMIPLILIGVVPILTGDIVKANFFPLAPLAHDCRWARSSTAPGTWRHYRVRGRHVPRRLVHLWLRDGRVLHLRIQESQDRHLQGDFLFRPALRRGVHPGALRLSGLPGFGNLVHPAVLDATGTVTTPAVYGGMLAPGYLQRHGRRRRHGEHGACRAASSAPWW